MASGKAFQDEEKAFKLLQQRIGQTGSAFQTPAGADAGFPDFGFTLTLPQKKVDVHIEYKNSHTAQMGSMRDWIFDGQKFYTRDTRNDTKADLIKLMNETTDAKRNGQRLLKDLQQHFHSGVREIYSGSMTIIKDKIARRAAAESFVKNSDTYQIANISNTSLGDKIIDHYKKKFYKEINRGRASAHLLMMFIKDEIWVVDRSGTLTNDEMSMVENILGAKNIQQLAGLTANLEVRIQPRGMTSNNPNKPVSIDVMASYRLKGKPSRGTKII